MLLRGDASAKPDDIPSSPFFNMLPLSFLGVALLLSTFAFGRQSVFQRECRAFTERREWRTFSKEERNAWISSVKCLTSLRHERLSKTPAGTTIDGLHSLYDDFALTHDMLEDFAHENAYFLPWHRYYLWLFDMALRDRCNYRGSLPYWDWTRDASDIVSAPVFDPDPSSGLGTNGDCTNTDCDVQDGAFHDVTLSYPIPHRLRRNITLTSPKVNGSLADKLTLPYLSSVMDNTTGDFFTFQYRFSNAHNHLHYIIRGDMNSECPSAYPKEDCDLTSFASNALSIAGLSLLSLSTSIPDHRAPRKPEIYCWTAEAGLLFPRPILSFSGNRNAVFFIVVVSFILMKVEIVRSYMLLPVSLPTRRDAGLLRSNATFPQSGPVVGSSHSLSLPPSITSPGETSPGVSHQTGLSLSSTGVATSVSVGVTSATSSGTDSVVTKGVGPTHALSSSVTLGESSRTITDSLTLETSSSESMWKTLFVDTSSSTTSANEAESATPIIVSQTSVTSSQNPPQETVASFSLAPFPLTSTAASSGTSGRVPASRIALIVGIVLGALSLITLFVVVVSCQRRRKAASRPSESLFRNFQHRTRPSESPFIWDSPDESDSDLIVQNRRESLPDRSSRLSAHTHRSSIGLNTVDWERCDSEECGSELSYPVLRTEISDRSREALSMGSQSWEELPITASRLSIQRPNPVFLPTPRVQSPLVQPPITPLGDQEQSHPHRAAGEVRMLPNLPFHSTNSFSPALSGVSGFSSVLSELQVRPGDSCHDIRERLISHSRINGRVEELDRLIAHIQMLIDQEEPVEWWEILDPPPRYGENLHDSVSLSELNSDFDSVT
ncbi:hypothetical protein D9758_002947 [Tetrapyrgos nigripes]|uniref:Tyrosinase copper-binding domain-containing protein n=1 Tax=Tetrapyrgos nigripes TaxID=182062 RepID=A0A8H5LTK0_9AGAR|nr:hypothetical protein D9758_002947 [Tetrapyrgos nigripes]